MVDDTRGCTRDRSCRVRTAGSEGPPERSRRRLHLAQPQHQSRRSHPSRRARPLAAVRSAAIDPCRTQHRALADASSAQVRGPRSTNRRSFDGHRGSPGIAATRPRGTLRAHGLRGCPVHRSGSQRRVCRKELRVIRDQARRARSWKQTRDAADEGSLVPFGTPEDSITLRSIRNTVRRDVNHRTAGTGERRQSLPSNLRLAWLLARI
jgi:hypothetical protein